MLQSNLILSIIFIIRMPQKNKFSLLQYILAMIIMFSPWFVFIDIIKPSNIIIGVIIQSIGIFGMIICVITLGRSFGISPALRKVIITGPYKIIRHPMYFFEVIFFVGNNIIHSSLWNWMILILLTLAQCFRILQEERILRTDAIYQKYMEKNKYRLIPKIW